MTIELKEDLGCLHLWKVYFEYLDNSERDHEREHKCTREEPAGFEKLLSEANDVGEGVFETQRVRITDLLYQLNGAEYTSKHTFKLGPYNINPYKGNIYHYELTSTGISFAQYLALGRPRTISAEQIIICRKVN
ncbi:hypothetical protein HZC30_03100 [Candidatus Woesearchaeota archaeon]|nr:hypothetical protein [Candidatus Woesearchaeota archaeon]